MAALLGIFGFLRSPLGRWVLLGVGVAAVAGGLWWWIASLKAENARLEEAKAALEVQLDHAVATAESNAEAARQVQRLAVHREEALARERDAALARAIRLQSIIAEVDHAPEASDGPVAPVLGRALERLRQPGAAAPAGDAGGGGAPGGAAPTAGVP